MPYTVGNGAILEVSIRGTYDSQRFISLFHYKYELPSGDTNGILLINTINPLFNSADAGTVLKEYTDCLNEQAVVEEVVYQWVQPTRRARVVKSPVIANGAVLGDGAPPNLAMSLTKRSDVAGRHGVGTLHMPALTAANYNRGRFTLLGQDLYGPLQTAILSPLNIEFGENMVPIVYDRVVPANSAEITTVVNNQTVRTMHRRTVGLGE